MNIHIEKTQGIMVVKAAGRLDPQQAEQLKKVMDGFLSKNVRCFVIDLEHITFASMVGVAVLVTIYKNIRHAQGYLALTHASQHLKDAFVISKLDHIFPIFDSLEEALPEIRKQDNFAAICLNAPAQRQFPRIALRYKVTCHMNHKQHMEGYSVNMSRGGLFIALAKEFGIGSVLTVDIHMPENLRWRVVQCQAAVVWVSSPQHSSSVPGVGVEIIHMAEEDRIFFEQHMDQAARRHAG